MTGYDILPDLTPLALRPWGIGAAAVALAVLALRAVLHRRAARVRFAGAKYVTVAAPPEVDHAGATLLWRHLAAIEHGRWRRFWEGQPYVIFEYHFTGPSLAVRIWVPGDISTAMVIDAVGTAWPGSTCAVTDAEPPLREGVSS